MVVDSSTALVATNPIAWTNGWGAEREASSWRDGSRWGNGIVYVGVEANRTKRIYCASGIPKEDVPPPGQLIDLYA